MITTREIKQVYLNIQEKLFFMIPEKWDSVYLYATITSNQNENHHSGEMFFYYFPKSALRRKHINVYEIPSKFNIDENSYMSLVNQLYEDIKYLRTLFIQTGQRPFNTINLNIEDFKFNIEFNYNELSAKSNYSEYERHMIWQYEYLNIPIEALNRKDKEIIKQYLQESQYIQSDSEYYTESVYYTPTNNIVEYQRSNSTGAKYINEDENKVMYKGNNDSYSNRNETIAAMNKLVEPKYKTQNNQKDKKFRLSNFIPINKEYKYNPEEEFKAEDIMDSIDNIEYLDNTISKTTTIDTSIKSQILKFNKE